MAAPTIILNECLFYILNKFDKATIKQLKLVIAAFYSEAEVHGAKELLHSHLEVLNLDDVPRLSKRKIHKVAVEDLVDMFSYADEKGVRSGLPTFAAANLARIPTVAIEDIEVFIMAQKLEKLETRLVAVETGLSSTAANANSLDCAPAASSGCPAPLTSTSTTSGPLGVVQDGGPQWSTVAGRRYKRSNHSLQNQGSHNQSSVPGGSVLASRTSSKKKFVGNNTNTNTGITSAVKIALYKKSVFHVDNVGADVNVDDIKSFLQGSGVRVETCFTTKTWMHPSNDVEVAAFRLCIHADDKPKLLSPDFWPAGVVIRDWKFKGKIIPSDTNTV